MSFSQAKGTAPTHRGLLYNLFSYVMVHKPRASHILKDDSDQNQTTMTAVGPLQSFCDLGTKLCNKIMNMTQTCSDSDWDTALEGNRLHKVQVTVTGEKTRSREVKWLHQGHRVSQSEDGWIENHHVSHKFQALVFSTETSIWHHFHQQTFNCLLNNTQKQTATKLGFLTQRIQSWW